MLWGKQSRNVREGVAVAGPLILRALLEEAGGQRLALPLGMFRDECPLEAERTQRHRGAWVREEQQTPAWALGGKVPRSEVESEWEAYGLL